MAELDYLTAAAAHVAAAVESAGLPVTVASVDEPGYPMLTPPFVAIDAPSVTEWAQYLTATPTARLSVPLRVVPASTADAAGLLQLADAVLSALHDGGLVITAVDPTVTAGQGTQTAMPAYSVTVELTARITEGE